MNYLESITAILTRYRLQEKLDPRELATLREWLMESQANLVLFDHLSDDQYMNNHLPSDKADVTAVLSAWIRGELIKIAEAIK